MLLVIFQVAWVLSAYCAVLPWRTQEVATKYPLKLPCYA
jgi:hypothetical protein